MDSMGPGKGNNLEPNLKTEKFPSLAVTISLINDNCGIDLITLLVRSEGLDSLVLMVGSVESIFSG